MFNGLLCSKSNSSLCARTANLNLEKYLTFKEDVNEERTEGRMHIYLHAFIYESSHYVQLFASNLIWTTQAQFTACSKQFCIYS